MTVTVGSPAVRLFARAALLPDGWAHDVLIEIDDDGFLRRVEPDVGQADAAMAQWQEAAGPIVPGMPNLHSHAFQRAMAGLTELARAPDDSFWTWREVMYRFALQVSPRQVQAIAAQLYLEMLKAGYTAVGEFHYLHHDPEGRPYGDPAEMARGILAAAQETGIGLTLLPVLYGYGGFGGAPTSELQRRFICTPEQLLVIVETLMQDVDGDPQVRIGLAPHSLRAVTADTLSAALTALSQLDGTAPVHIHVAEQSAEVDDCLAWCARRPVEWLLENAPVDRHWCLVHATHMTKRETRRLATSGAVAGLCPTTEANLGDGLFPATDFHEAGGHWGIGSDSHISVDPWEELRWLEYGQRLKHRRRNLLRPGQGGHVGEGLWRRALAGGAQALGRPLGALAPGFRADLLVLDTAAPGLLGREGEYILDSAIFAGYGRPVRDVMVGGRWLVREGRHGAEDRIGEAYRRCLHELQG